MNLKGKPRDVDYLKSLKLDFRGHYKRGTSPIWAMPQWLWETSLMPFEGYCPYCDQQTRFWSLEGDTYRPPGDCPNPDGIQMVWEQDFPSGKILVGNDLRWLNRVPEGSLEGLYGIFESIRAYADVGMTVAFGIGNSCPAIYRDGRDGLIVRPRGGKKKKLCSVCTDLWAYSMIDLEEGRRRALATGMTADGFDAMLAGSFVVVIKVPPGKYRFEHMREEDSSLTKSGWVEWSVFTRIKRIGPADPVFDFVPWYTGLDAHVWQATDPENLIDYARCLSLGIPERDWHPNGFPIEIIRVADRPFEDAPVPSLEGVPFSANTGVVSDLEAMCTGAGKYGSAHTRLNRSHAVLVGRILEHVMRNGLQMMQPAHRDLLARGPSLWGSLVALYPHVTEAMPDFDVWVSSLSPSKAKALANAHLERNPV
jgi:hypothetical protein